MRKIKVFIEYKIISEKRKQYLELTDKIITNYQKSQIKDYSIYEGIEQPNLFVEVFIVSSYEHFQQLKTERLDEKTLLWKDVHSCIHDPVNKVNIYAFEEV